MSYYAKEDVSAEQSSPGQDPRVQSADGNKERAPGAQETPGQGAQAPDAFALLKRASSFPKDARLRKPAEFRQVYAHGRRHDGLLMTAFVLSNGLGHHRLGVTASRKLSKSAVRRNRAKRLLRESFRLSLGDLDPLEGGYDWVLNARRPLLGVKAAAVLQDFRRLIARVRKDAGRAADTAQAVR